MHQIPEHVNDKMQFDLECLFDMTSIGTIICAEFLQKNQITFKM